MRSIGGLLKKATSSGDRLKALGLSDRDVAPRARAAVEEALAKLERIQEENRELTRRLAEAEDLADRDALAPVYNRRAFLRELQRIVSFAERYGARGAVLFVDLDGFKALNDLHGHAAGDAALRHVAALLLLQTRDSDVVGRIGGDEFAVVLANAGPEEAKAKANALAKLLAESECVFEGRRLGLRASFGVHAFSGMAGPCESAEALIARADEAMYAAKTARRGLRAAG